MRVCIIGASGHWPYAISGLSEYPGAELVGIAPGVPEELGRVQEIFSDQLAAGVPLCADYETLLDKMGPDVAVINPYFYLNGPITIECLRRGIHCYIEKPLTFCQHELETIGDSLTNVGD
jgi:predicted dehydrogenase